MEYSDENKKPLDVEIVNENDFEEVFQLTQFSDTGIQSNPDENFIVAEYDKIDIISISTNQKKVAKKFIQEVKDLIKKHAIDNVVGGELKNYLDSVSQLQMEQLSDLLTLKEFNQQMLNNMVHRINSVQGEDYALVQSYTALMQQHIKLHRELTTTYTAIPSMMKKMTTDINENLLDNDLGEKPIISSNYGVSQFNSSKEMLQMIKQKNLAKNKLSESSESKLTDS